MHFAGNCGPTLPAAIQASHKNSRHSKLAEVRAAYWRLVWIYYEGHTGNKYGSTVRHILAASMDLL